MLRKWISAAVVMAGSVSLAGCGAVSGAGGSGGGQTGVPANLSGNWLLVGTLPSLGFVPPPVPTGLTVTFDVIGSNASGILTMEFPCSTGFSLTTEGVVAGPIATDGSFTLQSPTVAGGNTLMVQGHVPASAGGQWAGTYTMTLTGCGTFSGQIAASPLPFLTGTFAASTAINGPTSLPITLKTNLQQGGYETTAGATLYSNIVLGGTIAITGSPCLTSGTTTGASLPSAIEGNTVAVNYLMNDGSTLALTGAISSVDSSTLKVTFGTISAGSCNTGATISSTQLVKQ